ncbi:MULTISPECIES: hypothetical protein [Cupriavidus]
MTDFAILAVELRECLDANDPDMALVALADRLLEIGGIEPSQPPHPLLGLAAMLIAGALLSRGKPDYVAPFLAGLSDSIAPLDRDKGQGYWRMLEAFHCLNGPVIKAALAVKDQDWAVRQLNQCLKAMRFRGRNRLDLIPEVVSLMAHPKADRYGPFRIESIWLLDRYEQALSLGELDHRLDEVQQFHGGFVRNALLAETPKRALPLIEQELPWYLTSEVMDYSHFEFNAICVLAALGCFEEAMAGARQLVRRGYKLSWRFHLESAQEMAWTQEMRQNEWLGALARTPDYQRFLKEDMPAALLGSAPAVEPLCVVRDGVWSGKRNKRCFVSRRLIKPGDPVVQFRRLFNRASDGALEMAASDVFATSHWQTARRQFESDSTPVSALFPRNLTRDARLHAPLIHAFAYDVASNPQAFDVERAVSLIADHAPPPIEYTWDKGNGCTNRWEEAFPSFGGAEGHGDAVNLAWRIVKAGFREDMLRQVATLSQTKADKVFAMLATFEDAQLRQAAAAHFDLPDLPQTMAVVFKDRLSLDDHEALAEFGGRNARYRTGLVAAMQAYGLHLYSNYRPKADWFLAGLERYAMARGSALLYLLIDYPEDDSILMTVIEEGWLPANSGGVVEEYGLAQRFYVRAALFHIVRNRPQRLDAWLAQQATAHWRDTSHGRETLRMINKRLSRKA